MIIQQNISLKPYNTFGIPAIAKSFATFTSLDELEELLHYAYEKSQQPLILGGGSNILITKDYLELVVRNEMTGIEVTDEDENFIYVKSAAGENWHQFVLFCIKNNYAGVENLSLIPGNVGASPMQNIGAYGVEIKDVFHELEAYHVSDKVLTIFTNKDCEFGYRESVFKRKYKGQFVITNVTFRLNKKATFNTSYGAIQQELDTMEIKELSIAAVSQAVVNIRQSKLPDPAIIGNAGSFFKNPTITKAHFEQLKINFPGIIGYPGGDKIKVAAGWLIEQCGWKGYRRGNVGCHAKQALVLVNFADARGREVYDLSSEIIESVQQKFRIILEREVNII